VSNDASRLVAALSDRYRIERELGQGGMATVYLARDLKHDRDVAVKFSTRTSAPHWALSGSAPKSGRICVERNQR